MKQLLRHTGVPDVVGSWASRGVFRNRNLVILKKDVISTIFSNLRVIFSGFQVRNSNILDSEIESKSYKLFY